MDPNQTQPTSPQPSTLVGEGAAVVAGETPTTPSASIQIPQPEAGKTKNGLLPILLLVLLVVLIVCTGFFVLTANNQTSQQVVQETITPSPVPSPQTPQEEVGQVIINDPTTDLESVTTDVSQL